MYRKGEVRYQALPLPDHSVDTVVVTYALCTIPDAPAALAQARHHAGVDEEAVDRCHPDDRR